MAMYFLHELHQNFLQIIGKVEVFMEKELLAVGPFFIYATLALLCTLLLYVSREEQPTREKKVVPSKGTKQPKMMKKGKKVKNE